MKVVKSGKDNDAFGKEFTCKGYGMGKKAGGCGAVLLVKPCDVETHVDCDGDATYWFTCPECGAKTYVAWDAFKH
ncbi:MAG TPA: hypothetical protein VLC10_02035 [Patescibacteria group bacterium]|nr:hypothetical protein [Patescibacteria group bacterium]